MFLVRGQDDGSTEAASCNNQRSMPVATNQRRILVKILVEDKLGGLGVGGTMASDPGQSDDALTGSKS